MTKEESYGKAMESRDNGLTPTVFIAMDLYAKSEAIAFKEWQDENLEGCRWMQYDGHDRWINSHNMKVISTEQLYNLYLQKKKL